MSLVVLATGGARSGKSAWAQSRAEALGGPRVFIATCVPGDDEMRARVERHRAARAERRWANIEEPFDLAGALARAGGEFRVALVDCLTLWIGNRMFQAEQGGTALTEDAVAAESARVLEACAGFAGGVVLVTGEVGLGVVPENAVARRFRDLLGRCNQTIAGGADEVTLVVCGQALRIK